MGKLFGEKPLVVDKDLAKIIGLNEAIVIQQIHYWLEINKEKNINFHDGKHWTYNTMKAWREEFSFWSLETVKRTFKKLREKNLLITGNFNKMKIDRTIWYSINYPELERIMGIKEEEDEEKIEEPQVPNEKCQNERMEEGKKTPPIPEISTENSKDIYNQSISLSSNITKDKNDRFDPSDFYYKYARIMEKSFIDHIDDTYSDAVKQAIRLLVLDSMNEDKISIGGRIIPRFLFDKDIEKINQFIIEHAINKFKKISKVTRIKNTVGYLKTCIYNAIYERKIEVDARLRYEGLV